MRLESYKDELIHSIVNKNPLYDYRIITDYKPKNKNEGTFAVVIYKDNKNVILCKGSLIKPIEKYYKVAGVYEGVCKKVYGKGNLEYRNSIKYKRVTIEDVEYDQLTEDCTGISMNSAITVSTLTHGDKKLVYKIDVTKYLDKYTLTSNRYINAVVHDSNKTYGTVTEHGIVNEKGEEICIDDLYNESIYCGVYKISKVYRRIA